MTVTPTGSTPPPSLDYYLVYPQGQRGARDAGPEGILVEEFVLAEDYTARFLTSAVWRSTDRRWRNSSAFSRDVRTDAYLRSRVAGTSRGEVEVIYRRLGGGELPAEEVLRRYFDDVEPLATSAPLRLTAGRAASGFRETRLYRILFANDLDRDGLADLQATWQMAIIGNLADPHTRVIGTAELRLGKDAYTWDLRRIGPGAGWCLDLTTNLAGSRDDAIGSLVRALMAAVRKQGLIPVTIERFY